MCQQHIYISCKVLNCDHIHVYLDGPKVNIDRVTGLERHLKLASYNNGIISLR